MSTAARTLLAGTAVAVLVIAGLAVWAFSSSTVDLRGDVAGTGAADSIFDASGFYPVDGQCSGHGDFSDIRGGAVVTVVDSSSQVVGTSQLQTGYGTYGACLFPFRVEGLPASDFYRVQVSGRAPVTWTLDEVMGENGIRLTVGS